MKIEIAVGTFLFLSCFQFLHGQVGDSSSSDFRPPKNLRGQSYSIEEVKKLKGNSPINKMLEIKTVAIPIDQSNWDRLGYLRSDDSEENPIKTIHIYGFEKLGRSLINSKIEDSHALKQFCLGLSQDYVRRPAIGDFTYRFGGAGGGAYLGVLQFQIENEEPILVGVASHSFYLDVHYGSTRQEFHSLPLAEALKRYLKSKGVEMSQEIYEKLSGLDKMRLPEGFED